MKTITLKAPISIGAGTAMVLSAAQLATRAHNVEIVKKGKNSSSVRVKDGAVLHFKAGEQIEVAEDSLPKALLGEIREAEEAIAAEAARKAAAAKAAARDARLKPYRDAAAAASAALDKASAVLNVAKPEEAEAAKAKVDEAQTALDAAEDALAKAEAE